MVRKRPLERYPRAEGNAHNPTISQCFVATVCAFISTYNTYTVF
jgi:hypothetical protein